MIYYEAATGQATFINARETAPAGSNETMYGGNGELSQLGTRTIFHLFF